MINLMFLGLNVIFLIFIWKNILRLSILDHYRDKLFDQRDKIREFYIANNISLGDVTYKNLRDLINGHLRFTEEMSFTQVIHFADKIENNLELKEYLKNKTDALFKTDNADLSNFIEKSRSHSSRILFNYMIFSSPILLMLLFVISLIYIPYIIIIKITNKITINVFRAAFRKTARIISRFIKDDDLEELSLRVQ